ncbi:hypothetical protein V1525DRAFT_397968 [Lipomyces kononenkoae]|uniref:Uncharacterized protein n=1 Tax=Lipomyces kononenkoae TaxID=34357 RepID=A0ACC3T7J2_LIPKO
MHSAPSPSLVPASAPRAPQFLRLSAPLETEKRNFLVLTAKVTPSTVTDEQKVVDPADVAETEAETRPRSESVASTASDVSSTNGNSLQRWVSNVDIPEESAF